MCLVTLFSDGRTATDDYSSFNDVWDKPDGGMHRYLYNFLTSPDATFQHIAVWTIVQLLESGGKASSWFPIALTDHRLRPPIDQQHTELWFVEPAHPPACIVTDAILYRYTLLTSFCFTIVRRYRGRGGAGGDTAACKAYPRVCGRRH